MTKGVDGNTYNAKLTLKAGKKFKFVNGKDFYGTVAKRCGYK